MAVPFAASPEPAPDPVLAVRGLRAYYRTHHFGVVREVRAVDEVDLLVMPGQIYGLAGESSSGKSTLVKTIAGAVQPPLEIVGGSIRLSFKGGAVETSRAASGELRALRWKHLSYIMQGSMSVLNPVRRIERSFVDFAARHVGRPPSEFRRLVEEHLQRLRLEPAVLEAYPHQLSGGMRQRVAIALATLCRPELIIADEPTTALDVVVQKRVLALIRAVQRELGSSLLFVTHDMAVHANLCDRLGIMYAGRLVEEGPTAELFRAPLHPYTRHLIASLPRIGDTAPREGLRGAPPSLADPPPGCRFHPRCPLAMEVCRREVPPLVAAGPDRRVACFAARPESLP
jgi:peptide/nickel transport system ATP-binding protein